VRGLVSATDLSAMAATLRGRPAFRSFVGLVGRVAAVLTVREDLLEAGRCLALLAAIAEDRLFFEDDSIDQTTISGALFDKAIILYARATAQGGNQRDAILHEDRLDPALLDRHRELLQLRNECVAHYGHGDNVDGGPLVRVAVSWSEYRIDDRQGFAVAAVAIRAQHRDEVASVLSMLIEAQLTNLIPIWHKVERKLHAEMKHLRESDPEFERMAAAFPFDPDELVPDIHAAARLRSGIEQACVMPDEYSIRRPKR